MNTKNKMITAIIIKTGKMIYSSNSHDINNDSHCWFSHPNGDSYECSFVMDNKEFKRLLSLKQIEIKKPALLKGGLSPIDRYGNLQ